MGCNARDKTVRHGRKPRQSAKLQQQQALHHHLFHHPGDVSGSDPGHMAAGGGGGGDSNPSAGNPPGLDEAGWGYCTEEQLEELLLRNLELVYREALARLVSLGYDDDLAARAILRSGHCYGRMDVLSNILHNALTYLNNNSPSSSPSGSSSPGAAAVSFPEPAAFSDLRHLEEYSLAGMVCLLQQVRPHLTRGDAMWCLLMSDLHVGRASTIDLPILPPGPGSNFSGPAGGAAGTGVPPGPCKFHGTSGGNGSGGNGSGTGGGEVDIECPKRFDLSPSMKSLLKRNVAAFAAGYHSANSKSGPTSVQSFEQLQHEVDAASVNVGVGKTPQNLDIVASVLSSLENLSLEEEEKSPNGAQDKKKEIIMDLVHQIRELEVQVKERKEWAQQKALQAAQKLSNDLTELKMLRMEREESLLMKKARQGMEDSTMKRLAEVEEALREVSGQVDRVNVTVRQLVIENLEIKAEIEAAELSASESTSRLLEVEKREKKDMKRLSAWEKQKAKLQEDNKEERKKIVELQQQLNRAYEAQKEAEVKWRQEVKAKEQAIERVEEEQKAKEAADASIRRTHEALRQKIEIDFQRQKDDIQRLEEELSRLKASAGSTKLNSQLLNASLSGDIDGTKTVKEVNSRTLHGLNKPQELSQKEVNHDRECLICTKNEVSVVFLPCAHQVLCASCSEDHEKRTKTCPCCSFQIEQRIRVFGACA